MKDKTEKQQFDDNMKNKLCSQMVKVCQENTSFHEVTLDKPRPTLSEKEQEKLFSFVWLSNF